MDSIKRVYLESSLRMWEWIAEEPHRTKKDYLSLFPSIPNIIHKCFLCEYRSTTLETLETCGFCCNEPCLVNWLPHDTKSNHYFRCEEERSLYCRWTRLTGMYLSLPRRPYLAQRLARGIVNLHRDALGLPHIPLWVPPEHRNRCDTEQRTSV